ncbi:cysteine hydrolase [uncultured Desulfobulbus sp.]|uniref:cysteine hydrolase n=1 Tax=uncultured Desulfobulbus sp. TaxID=239745 RepID=UPI0029C622F6|nr:cysteine hydrolase [uncultured Desulfobulbus sp.]
MKNLFETAAIPTAFIAVMIMMCLVVGVGVNTSQAQTVVDEWSGVKIPPPPELKQANIKPETTALLLLDFNSQTCNMKTRPRCIESIPAVKKLLVDARSKGVSIIYSLSPGAEVKDIAAELTPMSGEPVVTSGPDKYLGTDLEKILKEKKIETVIVTGTAAHGAVLYTASGAAFRGMNVIVPVDGLSAESLFPELYTVWNLANAPRVSAKTVITKMGLITY